MPPRPPILGFAAFSGVGKTTLLTRLIPLLRQRGLRIGLIKHGHHSFEMDKPGKDSQALQQAGANQFLIASDKRTVLLTQQHPKLSLPAAVDWIASAELDLVLIEGFKHHSIPKIELHRPTLDHPLLCLQDAAVIAVATDAPLTLIPARPILDLNDVEAIADFIYQWLSASRG